MNLTLTDVVPTPDFVARRSQLEREVLDAKRLRRVGVGAEMTFLFENRMTCWWQVQEMVRVEHITAPAAIQHELDTYNALMPAAYDLSATLLIEVDDPTERAVRVRALLGLQHHVRLEFGPGDSAAGRFDSEQYGTERVSTVQFVRFGLSDAQRRALADLGRPLSLVVDHPAYDARVTLAPTVRAALLEDLLACDA